MDQIAKKVLPAKKSSKGLNQGQMVESFVLLSALEIQPKSGIEVVF